MRRCSPVSTGRRWGAQGLSGLNSRRKRRSRASADGPTRHGAVGHREAHVQGGLSFPRGRTARLTRRLPARRNETVQSSDPSARRLVRILAAGATLLVLSGVMILLLAPQAWPVIVVGALLLCLAPLFVAATTDGILRNSRRARKTTAAHTFVVDLFQSVDHPPGTSAVSRAPCHRRDTGTDTSSSP